MATAQEKAELKFALLHFQSAVAVLKAQAPAIRDAAIRQRVEYACSLVAANLGTVQNVVGDSE